MFIFFTNSSLAKDSFDLKGVDKNRLINYKLNLKARMAGAVHNMRQFEFDLQRRREKEQRRYYFKKEENKMNKVDHNKYTLCYRYKQDPSLMFCEYDFNISNVINRDKYLKTYCSKYSHIETETFTFDKNLGVPEQEQKIKNDFGQDVTIKMIDANDINKK